MANTINLAKKYTQFLDEVYKKGMLTEDLEADPALVREGATVDTILLPKITVDGLGDYSRDTGYPDGSVTFEWETHTFTTDRAVEFNIDRQDNLEALDQVFAATSSQFARTAVAPEIDAYRFAELSSSASNVVHADLSKTDTVEAIDTAIATMDSAEVPEENRILYVTPQIYNNIRNADLFERNVMDIEDRSISVYDNIPVIKVPQSRFYTGITLNDGSATFGFQATTGGTEYEINFMLVHTSAALGIIKQNNMKVFDPDTNQDTDAWKMQNRLYHAMFTPDNKTEGIYVHTKGSTIA